MLTGPELAQLRADAETLLDDRLMVERATITPDDALNRAESWVAVLADVPCVVTELGEGRGEREAWIGGADRSQGEYVVRVPFGTDIRLADRMFWAGIRIEVSRVQNRTNGTLTTVLGTRLA